MAIEMFMKFVIGSTAVDAESQARFDTNDELMSDFKVGKFCDIEDFSLGMGLQDDSSGADSAKLSKDDTAKLLATLTGGKGAGGDKGGQAADLQKLLGKQSGARFTGWLDGMSDGRYDVDFEPFSFSKKLDKVSPQLFQLSCSRESFASISLVKRKPIGGSGGAKSGATSSLVRSQAYLRFDFGDVLVVGLDWDGGEELKEKCQFIARSVLVQYRPQLPDGTLGDIIPGQWERAATRPKGR